jgi:hypothetical protein
MNNQYVIQWKSKLNGRTGRGSKPFFREEAEHICAELNQEYPDIEHEVAEFIPNQETPEDVDFSRCPTP